MQSLSSQLFYAPSLVSLVCIAACGGFEPQASAPDGQRDLLIEAVTAADAPAQGADFVIHTRQKPEVGVAVKVRVSATDANHHVDPFYIGVAAVMSSYPNAVVPAAVAFTTLDHGEATFSVTFNTPGPQKLTIADPSGRKAHRSAPTFTGALLARFPDGKNCLQCAPRTPQSRTEALSSASFGRIETLIRSQRVGKSL